MSIHVLWFSQEYSYFTYDGYINISVRNDIFVFVLAMLWGPHI